MISSSSVITGTPNSCAFLDFDEPASSLQTRNDVFFDTLPVTLPPQSSIAFFALSRFSNLCREPVITNEFWGERQCLQYLYRNGLQTAGIHNIRSLAGCKLCCIPVVAWSESEAGGYDREPEG